MELVWELNDATASMSVPGEGGPSSGNCHILSVESTEPVASMPAWKGEKDMSLMGAYSNININTYTCIDILQI